ncbi:unnamed protein product [Rhizophagus irregularis]|nr:unnamed protein product [Rhizophagus irregularis]
MYRIDYPQYALSVDNLLKMALMLLRTRANIPVVVCGEAGCGKTSLIGFLAGVVEVEFRALNIMLFEEQSRLVYEVKPLPDQILDYVWDYGRLQPNDEKIYIQIMVNDQLDTLGKPILA